MSSRRPRCRAAVLLRASALLAPGAVLLATPPVLATGRQPVAEPAASADAAAAAPHPLAEFGGVRWTVRGAALDGGGRLDADIVFTPIFDGAAMHERTTVRVAEGTARVGTVYETLYGAPLADGTFGFVTVGSDGSIMEGRGRVEDGVFRGATDRRTDGAARGVRTLAPAADGSVRWIIERGSAEEDAVVHLDALLRPEAAGTLAIPAAEDDGPAARLAPMVGRWTTEATWATGEPLVGRNEVRLGRGAGYLVVDTYARDAGGPEHHRSRALYVEDPDRGWIACTADVDGRLTAVPLTLRDSAGGLAIDTTTRTIIDGEPAELAQTTAITGPDAMRWTVRARPEAEAPDGAWTELLDATWTRGGAGGDGGTGTVARVDGSAGGRAAAGAADAAAIAAVDPARFDVRGEPGGSFTVARTVPATVSECFRLWSTEDGVRSFLGIESRIELAVGGAYEWILVPDAPAGSRGSEGCQVLAWVPDSMLAFTWVAPPSLGEVRDRRSWVVLRFEPLEPAADGTPRTRVRIDHCGLGDGEDWAEVEDYFRRAWPSVLGAMQRHLEAAADPDGDAG